MQVRAQICPVDISVKDRAQLCLVDRCCCFETQILFRCVLFNVIGRGDADIEAEAGARLTCHLLLRLFKTVECPQPALYSVGQLP
jgi:hypothetical protein